MFGCGAGFLGVVLLSPWHCLFICPFAVAGLGFKYFRINFALIFGQPSRNPFRTAFNIVDNFGLHKDWCANFTAFTLVLIECVNPAIDWCGARPIQGPGRGDVGVVTASDVGEVHILPVGSGSVHKSVDGSLCPK